MSKGDEQSGESVDATGLQCPEPVMLLHAAIRRVQGGQTVRLVATDPSTQRDVANFCRFLGHELLDATVVDTKFCYLIRKAQA